jgi:hypothetical protein
MTSDNYHKNFQCDTMMKTPAHNQIARVNEILIQSLQTLIARDIELFGLELFENPVLENQEPELDRKLHEVTLNHRFAYYLERNLTAQESASYHVDIEFNRYYNQEKRLWIENNEGIARPDIIIHARKNEAVS